MLRKLLITLTFALLWAAIVIGIVFAEAYWFGQPAVVRGDVRSIENHLVSKLRDAADDRKLGSAALVLVHRGKIVAEHGFGIANAETRTAVRPEGTLYQLASVSKAVTAWGVMKLVQDGRIGLDEPVLRHLKRWRFEGSEPFRDKVTVRHLLSHTAGLDDGLGYGGFLPGEAMQTIEQSLASAKDSTVGQSRGVKVVREPGTAISYSGGGYTVLQLLIEDVTGRAFADYMKETVLQPLGMTRATFDWNELGSDLATAFDHDVVPQQPRRHLALASVSLYATPRDMGRFVLAFGGNRVLSSDTLRQMNVAQPGTFGTWGLGHTLFAENDAGGHVVGHDGGSPPAWGAMLRVNPATMNGMVLMVSGGEGSVNQLGHDWVYWETGKMTAEGRRQIVYGRVLPASLVIILGTVTLVFLRHRSRVQ